MTEFNESVAQINSEISSVNDDIRDINELISTYKKAVDLTTHDLLRLAFYQAQANAAKENATGAANDKLDEPGPLFIQAPSEKVLEGQNGSYIVLGRDRPGSRVSGYGGKGDTQAASMDMVVGRLGHLGNQKDENGEKLHTDPSFEKDAARIYLSQKADVDDYFNLPPGNVGNSKTKSAAAMKADDVRLVARQGIKLVAGVDKMNSQGGPSKANYGIDLMAKGSDEDLQPLVKGDNLVAAMEKLLDQIDALNGIVESFMREQLKINAALSAHTHVTPSGPAAPSVELLGVVTQANVTLGSKTYTSLITHKMNSVFMKYNHLSPMSKQFVCSRYNTTN
jgi:hypothetical protein